MQSPHTSGVRRSLQFALVLASSLSLASVCYAAQAKAPRTTLDKIQSARDAGDISQHQADQLVLDALFHPDRLEDKYLFDGQELLRANGRPLPGRTAGPIKARCGVPALKPILERYRTLARDVQVQVDELLRTRQSYVAELKFPSPGGHFLVHYSVNAADAPNNVDPTDTSTHGQGAGVFNSFNAPDYVEDVAAYFDASWTAFVGTGAFKFNAPPVDGTEGGGTNLLDVYVAEIGAYGITTLSWTVWVHVDRNMPRPMRKVTAAHEFFHCVQGSYDWFEPLWMIEGTAMYAEDVVYDDVNDYIGYSLNDHLYFPSLSLTEDANGGYSSVLYWKFFGEHYGTDGSGNAAYLEYASPNKIGYDDSGVDAIKKVMDALVDYEGTEGIDAVLAPVSKSFELSFCDWLKNNYLKDLGNPFAEGYLDYLEDENGYASITSSGLSRSWTVPSSGVLAPQTWNGLMSPWAGEFFRLSLSAMTGQINISLNGANDTASATNRFARLMVLCLGDANSDGYPDSMPQSFEYPLSAANDATASIPNAGYQQVIVIVAAADNGGDYALTVSTTAGAGTCTLTVQSTPVTGVAITGDKAGTTNYTASCTLNSTVSLSAPASLTSGGVPYTFTRWTIDGTPRTDGLNPVQVQMNANHTAVAVYTKVTYTLSVQSTPAGATITGDKPGTTNYAATCDALSTVSLTAAPSLTSGGVPYNFVRWTIDGLPQSDGVAAIQVYMSGNRTAVATYSKVTYSLTVQSTPAGATITGDKPGTTNYAATCDALSTVSLTAAPSLSSGGVPFNFVRWTIDGLPQSDGVAAIQV